MEDTRGVVRLGMSHDQRPEPRDLQRFLINYCEYWRDTGLQLGLQSAVLDQVAADYHTQRERFRVTLDKWSQVNVGVTWGDLELAITNAKRASLGYEPLTTIPTTQPEVMDIQSSSQHRQDDNCRQDAAVNVDHAHGNVDSPTAINFATFENVMDAFAALMRISTEELDGAKFAPIHTMCLMRADKRLRSKIHQTTSIHSLFTLLACNPVYLNWMNINFLQTMAFVSGNVKLQDTLKNYTDAILSKTLGEVWNDVSSFHKTKLKCYSRIKVKFHGLDPDDIKVKDLKKYQPKFAEEIALCIMEITRGSLTITWCVIAEETYEAYLLALKVPQELREDDFLQIGMWVVYPPQFVIQELERFYTMMSTSTLLIGYYHGLLLRSIDADLVTDKMCSVGLLTAHERLIISSGSSIYQKNWLLLEHVRHMDVQALRKFCEVVQEVWPQIGLQLITALKYRGESHAVTSEVKQKIEDIDTTSLVQLSFLHLIDQVHKLLQMNKPELVQQCKSLNASDGHKISLFSADQMTELSECDNLLMKLSPLFTWSNHSVLKALTGCSSEAVKLLDEFESKLDLLQPITSYPIPHLSSNMIPTDTSTYTILAIRCDKELYQCTLQYVYDVQSVMIEKCDITQLCLQLLGVRSDPTILYWTIPKCVVYLINTNVPLHSEYFYSKGILEVLVYPDLLLTTSDDVCFGLLAFECSNQFFSEELEMADVSNSKEYNTEAMLKHVHSQCDYLRSELEHKTKYANALEEILKKQEGVIDQTQRQEEQILMTTETTDKQTDEDTSKMHVHKLEKTKLSCSSMDRSIKEEQKHNNVTYEKELEEMKIKYNLLNEENDELQSRLDVLYKQAAENKKVVEKYKELKMDAFKTEPFKDELDEGSPLKVEPSTKVESTEKLKKEISELKVDLEQALTNKTEMEAVVSQKQDLLSQWESQIADVIQWVSDEKSAHTYLNTIAIRLKDDIDTLKNNFTPLNRREESWRILRSNKREKKELLEKQLELNNEIRAKEELQRESTQTRQQLTETETYLAISETKNDQLEETVEILKQELLQARQAVYRTENQTNMIHQKQQQQRDMATPQNKSAGSKHEFVVRSFEVPTRCDHCSSVMIGLVRQGMVCKTCNYSCHIRCADKLPNCPIPPSQISSSGLDGFHGVGTVLEGWVRIPKPGGVRKGWTRHYAIICDFKLFIHNIQPDTPTMSVSHLFDIKDKNFAVMRITKSDVIHANPRHLPCILKVTTGVTMQQIGSELLILMETQREMEKWVAMLEELRKVVRSKQQSPQMFTPKKIYEQQVEKNAIKINCALVLDPLRVLLGAEDGLMIYDCNEEVPLKLGERKVTYLERCENIIFYMGQKNRCPCFIHASLLGLSSRQDLDASSVKVLDARSCQLITVGMAGNALCLCTTNREKISVFELNLKKLQPSKIKEFSAPHHIQWVRLLSGQLCVGYVSGFMMFSIQDEMIPLKLVNGDDLTLGFIRVNDLNCLECVELNGGKEFLLCFHMLAVYVNLSGKRSRKEELIWHSTPYDISYNDPYLLVFTECCIEVYHVPTAHWIQNIPIRKARNLHKNGSLLQLCEGAFSLVYLHKHGTEDEIQTKRLVGAHGHANIRIRSSRPLIISPLDFGHEQYIGLDNLGAPNEHSTGMITSHSVQVQTGSDLYPLTETQTIHTNLSGTGSDSAYEGNH